MVSFAFRGKPRGRKPVIKKLPSSGSVVVKDAATEAFVLEQSSIYCHSICHGSVSWLICSSKYGFICFQRETTRSKSGQQQIAFQRISGGQRRCNRSFCVRTVINVLPFDLSRISFLAVAPSKVSYTFRGKPRGRNPDINKLPSSGSAVVKDSATEEFWYVYTCEVS